MFPNKILTQDEPMDYASFGSVDELDLFHICFDHLSESDLVFDNKNAFCSKCCFFYETCPHSSVDQKKNA